MKILNLKSFFVAFVIVLGCMAMPSETNASLFVFQNKVMTVESGQTFMMPVAIDPSGLKNYTVRFTLGFPSDMLEVTSFDFAPTWLAVPQPRYDLIDNKSGELIKTAGFPQGFSSSIPFGTVTFRAKSIGKSIIAVGPRSFVLNAENKSTLESRPQIRVIATEGGAGGASSTEPLPNLPQGETNLFDISLVPEVKTSGAGLVSKVAPGEVLPLSVKLLNFGNRHKVDVRVSYTISDLLGKAIYSAEETVAVETTATFVKTIQIPFETIPGRYIAKSSITYQDQVTPATTEFPFMVERRTLGLFQSDFYRYVVIVILLGLLVGVLGFVFAKRRRLTRSTPFDYSDIPRDERVFFELLSDTIMEMRQRVGDRALDVARQIDGLVIDIKTGRVLKITEKPSKIIAGLVAGYEKTLGKKVSFSFRPKKTDL